MSEAIIYIQDNGIVAIVYPTPEALAIMTIVQIAEKDVPTGKAFKIINTDEIPTDRAERVEWAVDGIGV